ncbi:Ig-like domain-containing protein [Bacillus sp. B-jedd]|uniref:Ig-like domain-containing protein n=1 Tax=Bacillus sp. B-jedd TaxID=1476857 RepID=UPI0005156A7A|nr:Ig-like domain-containing protein [Bacillus sp. B-jedd]CEG29285.1 peptidase M30, hyicolysin [Bacillus sp. B-jedd]
MKNYSLAKKWGSTLLATSLILNASPMALAAPAATSNDKTVTTGRTELNKTTGTIKVNPIPARKNGANTVLLSGTVVIDGPKLELKVNDQVVNAKTTKIGDTVWAFEYIHTLKPENVENKKDEQIVIGAQTVYQNGKTAGQLHTMAQPATVIADLTPPDILLNDYSKVWTNESITVTAELSEKGTLNATSHTFDENGSFTFVATDVAGNVTERTVTIDNIDKEAPEAKVAYSTTSPINTDVVATIEPNDIVTYTNLDQLPDFVAFNEDASTLIFSQNGSFELKFNDKAGNPGSLLVEVNNIDKEAPVGSLTYSASEWTNQDVTATVTVTKPVTFNENNKLPETVTFTKVDDLTYTLTFAENEKVNLEFVDAAGNRGEVEVNVTNIDKVAPTASVSYSTEKLTNQDVIVTLEPSEDVTILNNDGSLSKTFTENGEYEFLFVDKAGNEGSVQVFVNNIDKIAPKITLSGLTTEWTNQDITVTASMDEDGTLNAESHTFTENGSFEFVATDLAGNVTRQTVQITNIDKKAPEITVKPYNTNWTNQDITVEVSMDEEGTLNKQSHTFTENGSFTFEAKDRAGNITEKTVTISNIDKVAPEITVEDYVTNPTNQDITVKVSMNEPGTLNEESYTFTENGEFEFIATDRAGNETKKKVVIDNIDKVAPIITVFTYNTSPTNQDVVVTAETNEGTLNTTSHTFTENGSFDFIAKDAAGNETVETITITNIDKVAPVITVNSYNESPTNQDVTVTVATNEGTLNVSSHTFTENGEFEFVAIDAAGNVTKVKVAISNIDKTPPTVNDVINGFAYNTNVKPTFTEGKATLNGATFISGTAVSAEGSYTLIVTDDVGNAMTVTFTIDKTAPVVSGVLNNQYYNVDVRPTFNEGTATLNGNTFVSGTTISSDGVFTLLVRDAAGNVTTVSFTIDKIRPSLQVTSAISTTGNVKTTTVTGSAEPGASISVFKGNTRVGIGSAGKDGSFSILVDPYQTNNTLLTVRATDKADNFSEIIVTVSNK